MSAEQEENRTVRAETPEMFDTAVEQRERDRVTPWRHPLQTLAIELAAGNPIGENVSRTLTDLRRARLIEDRSVRTAGLPDF